MVEFSVMKMAKGEKGKTAVKIVCLFLAEFFGTFMLLLLGCMANGWGGGGGGFGGGSLQFGLAVFVAVQVWGVVSGAHINPAVTLGALLYGVIHPLWSLLYIIAQIAGALAGYICLRLLDPKDSGENFGCITSLSVYSWQGMCIEFCLTGGLMLSLCAIWDPRNEEYQDTTPVRIGLVVACAVGAGSSYTGGSLNPARSFAPALYHNKWERHWVYWVGPLLGAAISALFYRIFFRREKGDESDSDVTTLDA